MSQHWTWKQAIWLSELPATTKLVLQALASHLNDMGDAMFPSQSRLSRYCSLSERSVITHLQEAERLGWIRKKKRNISGKEWASNEYLAAWPEGVKEIHPINMSQVKEVQVRGEGGSPDGVKEVHTNSPLELSKEHSIEDFEKFWNEYPNKIGKPAAKKIWEEKELTLETVLPGLTRWKATKRWTETEDFIPYPATWLKEERWNDLVKEENRQLTPTEIEAVNRKLEESKQRHLEQVRLAQEQRRKEWGLSE